MRPSHSPRWYSSDLCNLWVRNSICRLDQPNHAHNPPWPDGPLPFGSDQLLSDQDAYSYLDPRVLGQLMNLYEPSAGRPRRSPTSSNGKESLPAAAGEIQTSCEELHKRRTRTLTIQGEFEGAHRLDVKNADLDHPARLICVSDQFSSGYFF